MSDTSSTRDLLLRIEDLKVHFGGKSWMPGKVSKVVHAVDGVSFEVERGKTFGIVGESGSGKTTTALATVRLAPVTEGRVFLDDLEVSALKGEALRLARKRFQIIFQDPFSSLNPRIRAGQTVREPLDLMEVGAESEREGLVQELFAQVGLRPEQRALFPHQFSGGQRQRIGLARAIATRPELVVCDEPVSALDVAIQAQILNLMRRLQDELGLTYLFISHDLGVVQYICDEIAVMYLGQIVEQADRVSLFVRPQHPYTKALLSAVPSARPGKRAANQAQRIRLEGDPPSPINLPKGCRFAGRCPLAEARCHETPPELKVIETGHKVACHLV
ncbi:ABC transporter ATP-binding protein [Pelagibius sp. Alg239-R121]|uniref:ABC transporter ATP-binding protein n=1 Tax=Pelagibius sp. Alg239-R121 TaxID=2993448 RepID=UPI0024A73E6C|nr:oligopeptide/dipeptide ABC transporter ATP-binding protein [Pelagibius sp. Alg239-R121]